MKVQNSSPSAKGSRKFTWSCTSTKTGMHFEFISAFITLNEVQGISIGDRDTIFPVEIIW